MKPGESREGDKRDADDLDAPTPDGFTILDVEPDAAPPADSPDDESEADDEPAKQQNSSDDEARPTVKDAADEDASLLDGSDEDTADQVTAEADASPEADDKTENGNASTENEAEAKTLEDSDEGGELSFDEWLAAAELPTDEPTKPGEATKDTDDAGEAAASGRGRKKNRRSRRSRKKSIAADTAAEKKSLAETNSPSADGTLADGTMAGSTAAASDGDSDGEVVGTSMSEIMAELLAAAEQSSLDRPDGDAEVDTEVELDPEATSEFASAAEAEKTVSAAIAAAKASAPTLGSDDADSEPEAKDSTSGNGDTTAGTDEAEPSAKSTDSEDASSKDAKTKKVDTKAESSDGKGSNTGAEGDTKDKTKKDTAKKTDRDAASKTSEDTKDKQDKTAGDKANKQDKATEDKAGEEKAGKDKPKKDVSAAPAKSQVESKTAGPTVAPLRRPEKSSTAPTVVLATVAAVVGLYAILVVGWALDSVAHSGEAMRGVQLANISVGGSNEEALGNVLDTLDVDLEASALAVSVDDVDISTDPFSLGVRHDREPMVDQALDARRGGFIAFRPIRWLGHLFTSENIPAQYTIDEALAADGVEDIIRPELIQPVEPRIELQGSQMALVPGANGVAVDPDEIIELLPDIIGGSAPYELALSANNAAPVLTDDAVAAVVDEINEQTEQPVLAQVLDQDAEISPRMMKTWMILEDDDDEPTWSIDEELALENLKPLFPALGSEDQQARFSVVDGEPIIIPASETVICCEEETLISLTAAIKRGIPDPIEPPEGSDEDTEPIQQLRRARLEPAITGNDEGVAELESLGIIEEISTFTTPHACCQNRVINIQRFADLMQGVVIRPGEEFSLNEFVGRRTRENGFVADGAIVLGNFEPQVGGGISQYATTFFNASFFAGIEFLEYQSHSIYISRYPRGREATISWRRPDLKVLNNTDYGILVWNEYTDTSITVTFYSTKNREVEALPLLRSSDRQCRIDITPRVITFEDGTVEEDSVRAIYRPGQGLDCNGNSTTPEEDPPPPANNETPDPSPDPDGDDDEVLPPGG